MFKVEQMINRKGNYAANQFIMRNGNKTVFQSYSSIIVEINRETKTITFYPDWNYSKTTSKHRTIFLEDENIFCLSSAKEIEKAIKKGTCENGYKVILSNEQ